MSWFARTTKTFEVRSTDEATASVTIKKWNEGEVNGRVDLTAQRPSYATTRQYDFITSIVRWTLTDDDGKPLPVTHEVLEQLDPDVLDEIHAHIRELNPSFWTPPVTVAASAEASEEESERPTGSETSA